MTPIDRMKFRVWCKHHEAYEPHKITIDEHGNQYQDGRAISGDDHEFEFATGFRDKNENLIYDGDTFEAWVSTYAGFSNERARVLWRIAYDYGSFKAVCIKRLEGREGGYLCKFELWSRHKDIEITGNIHDKEVQDALGKDK